MPPVFRHLARQPIRRCAPCSPLPFRLLASCMLALLLSLPAAAQLGYFHVENRNGVWWMIDPQDQTTMLAGVDRMLYRGPAASSYFQSVKVRYPDESAWDFEALARLKLWRFNMIGPESDPTLWNYRVPYVMDLHIAEHSGADWRKDRPLDVFDPAFAKNAQEVADEDCLPRTTDHWLVGYLSDDDMPWSEARSRHASMLATYLRLPTESPGRRHAIEFLRVRYRDNTRAWALAWGMKRVKPSTGSKPLRQVLPPHTAPTLPRFWPKSPRATSKFAPPPSTSPIPITCTSAPAFHSPRPKRC